jgi:hypothetical protein
LLLRRRPPASERLDLHVLEALAERTRYEEISLALPYTRACQRPLHFVRLQEARIALRNP